MAVLQRNIAGSFALVTAPVGEPVSIEEAKTHLGYDATDREAELHRMIIAARRRAEQATERAFFTQTWDLRLDYFPLVIELRKPPIISVTSVTYVDVDNATQTFDDAKYNVDIYGEPGRIVLDDGQTWPTTRHEVNAVTVRFVAGYGTAAGSVPAEARDLILMLVQQSFLGVQAEAVLQDAIDALIADLSWSPKL